MKKLMVLLSIIIFLLALNLTAGTTSIGTDLKAGMPNIQFATVLNVTEMEIWDGFIIPVLEYRSILTLPVGLMTNGHYGIPVLGIGFIPTAIPGIDSKLGDIALGYILGYDMDRKGTHWGIYLSVKIYEDK